MSAQSISFGPFVFDCRRMSLARSGKPVPLGGRASALLARLLEADGAVVGKSALMEAGWPTTIVEDGNLTAQIRALRRALGLAPDGKDWIDTVERVGYRLHRREVPPAPGLGRPAVAVLPFANMSGDPEQAHFADGIVEDLTTALSRFKSFTVVARNTSFVYDGRSVDVRQAGKELGARYLLEGSVRRSGDRVRISAQLIEAASGTHLWAETFDGTAADVFDFQDRITISAVGLIEPEIRKAEIERARQQPEETLTAYDLVLLALQRLATERAEDNAAAIALLDRAIVLEPGLAMALATAAGALEHRISMGWPSVGADDRQRCIELARLALAEARDDATVLARCGFVTLAVGIDYDRGLQVLRRAVEANPNNMGALISAGIGHLLAGSLDDALSIFHRAVRLSPGDPKLHLCLGGIAHAQMALGNFEDAVDWAGRSLAVNPNFDAAHWLLIASHAQLGRLEAARFALAQYLAAVPGATLVRVRSGQHARDPRRIDVVIEGLRLAGMPEG